MNIEGWKYYNHAAIPTTAPHLAVNLAPLYDKTIWKIDGGPILLVRWTTDFETCSDTHWYYLVKKAPYNEESLTKKARKNIRYAHRHCIVKRINPWDYLDELFDVYNAAYEKYENADNQLDKDDFITHLISDKLEFWAGFSNNENKKLIGWISVNPQNDYCDISVAKFHPEFLKLRVSDALYSTILDYYLNQKKLLYVSSGTKSINHVTNTQEYKISHFGYEKVNCVLHIMYNPSIAWIIPILYKFKSVLIKADNIKLIHQINSVMALESIVRYEKKMGLI